jgi:hypothetical protein
MVPLYMMRFRVMNMMVWVSRRMMMHCMWVAVPPVLGSVSVVSVSHSIYILFRVFLLGLSKRLIQ